MSIDRVCLLGLGEVGAILADDLLANTEAEVTIWDRDFDSPGSAAYQHLHKISNNPRVHQAASAEQLVVDGAVVLSVVTADEALNAARPVLAGLPPGAWFVDLNSVSPGTKQQLAEQVNAVGARFVEAAVMSPINPLRSASPILLAGPHAADFEPVGKALGFIGMQAIAESYGTAAATKMCRSVIVKGMEALVSESLLAARHYGVDEAVLASLQNLFPRPDWPDHARYLISRTLMHGTRRASEMREVAKTVEEAGLNAWMSEACVSRQDWAPQFSALLGEESLDGLLDAMRAQIRSAEPGQERSNSTP